MSCRGLCDLKHETAPLSRVSYRNGFKFCTTCRLTIKWDGVRCPCCSTKLRTHAARTRSKLKRLAQVARI